jgi:tetratricopeptide (TPR) repeat protein
MQNALNSQNAATFGTVLSLAAQLLSHDMDAALDHDWDTWKATVENLPALRRQITDLRNYATAFVALERGDPHAVELWTAVRANEEVPASVGSHDDILRRVDPWLALAKARSGDTRGGQALIAETPLDCRICVDMRGHIAALAGNTAESEKWFAQAIGMAPKLPQAFTDRGQARLDRGDIAGALADATGAASLSPHDGDAWKLWGEILAKRGNIKEALAKYEEALKYAPNWKQLKEAREALAKQKS